MDSKDIINAVIVCSIMEQTIYQVSALNGWDVTVETKGEVTYVNFQRMTVSGVHFTLTVEMRNNSTEWLADEILSFVDAFVPENYAAEWMKQAKTRSLVKFRQAVDDMKDIRMRAWSLACALSLFSEGSGIVPVFPWKGGID